MRGKYLGSEEHLKVAMPAVVRCALWDAKIPWRDLINWEVAPGQDGAVVVAIEHHSQEGPHESVKVVTQRMLYDYRLEVQDELPEDGKHVKWTAIFMLVLVALWIAVIIYLVSS